VSILNLLIVSYLDCPVFEFLYLLQLPYPFNYFVLCACLYLLVPATLLHFLKVFLAIFDFLDHGIEQILQLFILFLLGLHVPVEKIKGGAPVFFFIVLESTLSYRSVVLPTAFVSMDIWQRHLFLLSCCYLCIELFFIFKLETFLKIIDHAFAIYTFLAWRKHSASYSLLLINLGLYFICLFPPRNKVNSMILLSRFLLWFGVLNYGFLRALFFF